MHLVTVLYCSRDLELNPTTLPKESDLDIVKISLHYKTEVCRSRLSNVRAQREQTQTDATKHITMPYSLMITIAVILICPILLLPTPNII